MTPHPSATAPRRPVTVAIDGPSGAGKGTVGRRVAHVLGYRYIDTGAMYRAVALLATREDVALDDAAAVTALSVHMPMAFAPGDPPRVLLGDEDVTEAIRAEVCGNGASIVSQIAGVRGALVDLQRRMGVEGGIVMDGRDIGTEVFPRAEVKIYLTASVERRVARRITQLSERNHHVDADLVRRELGERDHRDMTRAVSPLRKAEDAIEVDTSDLSPDQVVDHIVSLVRAAEVAAARARR